MDFLERIKEYEEDIIKSTQEVVKIKSVEEEPLPGMPFGKGVHDAYWYVMNLGESMGFQIKDLDGYAGHIDFGEGEEIVGILGHIDVVPEGENWTYPPYGGEIHEGKIYGRGTSDDKGPVILALYAMKILKDSGIKLNKKIRLIIGNNEETGWKCMEHYFKNEKAPDMAFTPDACYPVINGEKGILNFSLEKELQNKQCGEGIRVYSITGGTRSNVVVEYCEAVLSKSEDIISKVKEYGEKHKVEITVKELEDKVTIRVKGVSAHGSMPEHGINAASHLFQLLNGLILAEGDIKNYIKFYAEKIGLETNGDSIGCGFKHELGDLTFNVGVVKIDEKDAKVTVNVRYPINLKGEQVLKSMENSCHEYDVSIVFQHNQLPIFIPEDSELIRKLMAVYSEVTGDNESRPITIGGGTYARAMKNCVAFGCGFPGEEDIAHQKDEYMSIYNMILNVKIMVKALYELAK